MNNLEWKRTPHSFLTERGRYLIKIVCVLSFLFTSTVINAQEARVTIHLKNQSVKNVLKALERESEYSFFYNDADFDSNRKVSIEATNEPLSTVLTQILPANGKWTVQNKKIILLFNKDATAQAADSKFQSISGTVCDARGEALIGVNVTIPKTSIGAITDAEGNYRLKVPADAVLLFSYIGYLPKTVQVRNSPVINIVLTEDTKTLDEVVIVGYGMQKKINLTGAISQIDAKALDSRPLSNLGQGLQGLIPNLIVSTNDGRPGSSSSYNIRGTTSLNGGNPLILVDGVQMDPNQINPNDVESVTVLKDAASAAIYGGRAAYGVILITTKKGKKDSPIRVNYSYDYTLTRPTRLPDLVNSLDYINMYREADATGRMTGGNTGAQTFTELDIEKIKNYMANPTPENAVYIDPNDPTKYRYVGNTNWTKEMYPRWAPQQQHNLSLNGGSEKMSYLASLSAFKQKGLLPDYIEQKFKRYNASLSLNAQPTTWLDANLKMTVNRKENDQPVKLFNGGTTIDTFSDDLSPLMPVFHPDGHFSGQGGTTNPLAVAALGGRDTNNSDDIWLTAGFTIRPLKHVSVSGDYTWNSYRYNSKTAMREFYQYGALPEGADITDPNLAVERGKYPYTNPATVSESNNHDIYTAFNVYAQYENTFAKKHYVKAMIGYNQESKENESFNASVKGLLNQDYPYIKLNNDDKPNVGSGIGEWALIGTFFRLNYIYNDKYLVEFNGRYDGSSRFQRDNRYVFSPSVSVGYRLSEEKFFLPLRPLIDNFKIRLSYGELPNQQLSNNYPYLATMPYGKTNYIFDNVQQVYVSAPGLVSTNFSWETVTTKDIGIDFTMLNNRLSGSFDYYIRDTKDMIVAGIALPAVLGTGAPQRNAADLRTKGFELELAWNDRIGKDFSYRIGFNLSDYQAKITKYDLNPTGNVGSHYVGKKMGEIWGYVTEGFYATDEEAAQVNNSKLWGGKWLAGDIKFKNLNGDKTEDGKDIISPGDNTLDNPGDRKIIGNDTPRYNYGISLGANYKNFDLSMLMQGVGKRDVMLSGTYFWGFATQWKVPTTEQQDAWTSENRDAYYPRLRFNGGGNFQTQTKYLQNAAYLRMKQITIGYRIPKDLLNKVGVDNLRIYFTGQNLFEFTKMMKSFDPEQPNRQLYPLNRDFSFGVQISL